MRSRFRDMPIFRKSTSNNPQMILTCSRSKVHICILHVHASFHPFRSRMSHFRVTAQFCSRSKVHTSIYTYIHIPYIHITYIPEAQVFIRFGLMMSRFRITLLFRKVHQMTPNDLDMFKVKNTNMHATYTPKAQIFVRFALRRTAFEICPFFGKVHRMTPK